MQKRIQAFLPSDERFILMIGFIAVAITVWFGLFQIKPTSSESAWLNYLGSVLFLNATHVAFTFHALLFFPETQSWRIRHPSSSHLALYLKWALFYAITVTALYLFFEQVRFDYHSTHPAYLGMAVLVFIIPYNHGIKQIQGIAMIYDQKLLQQNPDLRGKITRHLKFERLLFTAILCISILSTVIFIWKLPFPAVIHQSVLAALVVLALFNSWYQPGGRSSNKTLFLIRLTLFPMMLFSKFATVGVAICHGTEYLAVYRRLAGRQAYRTWPSILVLILLVLAVMFLCTLNTHAGLGKLIMKEWPQSESMIHLIMPFYTGFVFMHVYFDRIIFRMKDPAVRQTMGAALLEDLPPALRN